MTSRETGLDFAKSPQTSHTCGLTRAHAVLSSTGSGALSSSSPLPDAAGALMLLSFLFIILKGDPCHFLALPVAPILRGRRGPSL